MNQEFVTISNYSKSGIGVILVLFILLVIVVQTFCDSPGNRWPAGLTDNGTVSPAATKSFYVVNRTPYWLTITSLTGNSSLPSPRIIEPEPSTPARFEVTNYGIANSSATATYIVNDSAGQLVGGFRFTMRVPAFGRDTRISNIEVTGALVVAAIGTTLYVER
ncbi:hypothetical protein SAMN05444162_0340 [Paenibacillaceae bacterium GAS479]|nr:hypothetical protein SAMN05444162_0340 [Paenibacillaceae bacterium GAS479]